MSEGGIEQPNNASGTELLESIDSEDTGGVSLMDFCAQLDDCTPTVRWSAHSLEHPEALSRVAQAKLIPWWNMEPFLFKSAS